MIYRKIYLRDINEVASKDAYIELYLHEEYDGVFTKRPAMLIAPGGGYFSIAPLEANTVALRFASEGFNTFTISYAIDKPYPIPHLDLAIATSYIKLNVEEFGLDNNFFILGFSAGGHLVGSYSYLYKELSSILDVNDEFLRPTAIVLSYPVISMTHNTHIRTRDIICDYNEANYDKFSIEKHVTKDYPPTFIWTTLTDTGVNPSNTLDMIKALEDNKVLYDSILFDSLDHGRSVMTLEIKEEFKPFTTEELTCRTWVDKVINFLTKNFY